MHPGLYTGMIVEEAALLSKSHALIQKERKAGENPLDEAAVTEFNAGRTSFVNDFGVKLELAILGMVEPGIEIQASHIENSVEIVEVVKKTFQPGFDLRTNTERTLSENAQQGLQTVWLSLGPDEREFKKEQLVSKIADLVGSLNAMLGLSESDERVGGVLD